MSLFQPRYFCCELFLLYYRTYVLVVKVKFLYFQEKPTLSPALETTLDYQLKIVSVAISYGGSALLRYRDQFKEAVMSAFDSPSWKVLYLSCGFLK